MKLTTTNLFELIEAETGNLIRAVGEQRANRAVTPVGLAEIERSCDAVRGLVSTIREEDPAAATWNQNKW